MAVGTTVLRLLETAARSVLAYLHSISDGGGPLKLHAAAHVLIETRLQRKRDLLRSISCQKHVLVCFQTSFCQRKHCAVHARLASQDKVCFFWYWLFFCDLKISIENKCTLLTMLVVLHVTLDGRDGHLKPLIHLGESTGDNSRRGGTP